MTMNLNLFKIKLGGISSSLKKVLVGLLVAVALSLPQHCKRIVGPSADTQARRIVAVKLNRCQVNRASTLLIHRRLTSLI